MMNQKNVCLFLLALILPAFFFASCAARIEGTVQDGGSAWFSVRASLEPRTMALINSLRGFMGGSSDTPVLDGASITRSLAAAPGIQSVLLENSGPETLEGTVSISNVGNLLESGGRGFITYTEDEGESSVVVILDINSAPRLISSLSPQFEEYLSALMAPVVLGESMGRQEYLNIVTSIYGRPLANEIAEARIRVFVDFPREPVRVLGGVSTGRRVEFDIPLVDILVLEQPIHYEVAW